MKREGRYGRFQLIALAMSILLSAASAHAATFTYNGGAFDTSCVPPDTVPFPPGDDPSDWNDPRNWGGTFCGGGGVPGANDTAIIPGGFEVRVPTTTIGHLTLQPGSAIVNRDFNNQVYNTLTVNGLTDWATGTNGSSVIGCNLTLPAGATMTIRGSESHIIAGSTITNAGTIDWTGGHIAMRMGGPGGATFEVVFINSGTFKVRTPTSLFIDGLGAPIFSNTGTLEFNTVTGGATFNFGTFHNRNVVNVKSGNSLIEIGNGNGEGGGGTQEGTFQSVANSSLTLEQRTNTSLIFENTSRVIGAGRLILQNLSALRGTLTAGNSAGSNGTIEFRKNITSNAAVNLQTLGTGKIQTISTVFDLAALGGPTWTVTTGSRFDILGDGTGATSLTRFGFNSLVNNGTINWLGGDVTFGSGLTTTNTTIVNNGTFNVQSSDLATIFRGNVIFDPGQTTFTNNGIINKSNANKNSIALKLVNPVAGRINGNAGVLDFPGSFPYRNSVNGVLKAAAGAFIDLSATDLNSTTLTGSGRTRIVGKADSSGQSKIIGTVTAGVAGQGGALDIAGDVTSSAGAKLTGPGLLWTSGDLIGQGTQAAPVASTITVAPGGTMKISDSSTGLFYNKGLNPLYGNVKLINEGATTWTDGNIGLDAGTEIQNTGTFNANSPDTILARSTAAGTFRNLGILNLGTAGSTKIFTLGTGNSPTNFVQSSAGRLNLKISGDIPGTQHDQVNVTGGVTLAGVLGLSLLNNFSPVAGSQFTLLDRAGTAPLTGIFAGMAQNAVVTVGGKAFRISYTGGDGNDVVLTRLLEISISDVTVSEGDNGTKNATFTITQSEDVNDTVRVTYATQNGTAVAPSDYTATSGTKTLAFTGTTDTITVPVIGDVTDESNETFTLRLTGVTTNFTDAVITDNAGVATITNDDGSHSLTVNNPRSLPEGNVGTPGSVTFDIALNSPSAQSVTVNYQTTNGINNPAVGGSDYVAKSGKLTFSPGETLKRVTIQFIGDSAVELNETFFFDLLTPTNATIADSRGVGQINNDDGPGISIGNAVTADEGNSGTTSQTFVVTLSAASTNTVTVDWTTANSTATANDFVAASGTLTFAPGETSKTITVLVNGDTSVEPNETYKVILSKPTFAFVADSLGIGIIRNDDTAALLFENDEPSQ